MRPKSLQPGGRIGIVSPSSPGNEDDLRRGIACFEARGYVVELAPHALDRSGGAGQSYLAGTDYDRADDLNCMFARTDIDAIICSRGGYGSIRILDLIDWDIVKANPKIFVGFSDITTLHLGMARLGGFVTFHGPMVCGHANLNKQAKAQFWQMLENTTYHYAHTAASPETSEIKTIVGGTVEGELAGGCLSLLAHNCGSRYAPDFNGKLVLIEDIGEKIYRADRCLQQLRIAGALEHAAGFIIGGLTNWDKVEAEPETNMPDRLFEEFFGKLGKPTISGFQFGHVPNPLTLPLGAKARLNATEKSLEIF